MRLFEFLKKEDDFFILEEKKTKLNKMGEQRYKYLSNGIIKFYYMGGIISLFILALTLSLAVINMNQFDTRDSGDSRVTLSGTTLFLVDRAYHPNTREVQFLFQIHRRSLYRKQPIEMVVAERRSRQELPSRILELGEEYILIIVSEVEDNWREIVIDLGEREMRMDRNQQIQTDFLLSNAENRVISFGDFKQGTFFFSRENTPTQLAQENMTDLDYLRYYAIRQIEIASDLIENHIEDIFLLEEVILDMYDQIRMLENAKQYQTTTQQQNTKSDIRVIESEQGRTRNMIQDIYSGIEQLMERVDILEQWLADHPS